MISWVNDVMVVERKIWKGNSEFMWTTQQSVTDQALVEFTWTEKTCPVTLNWFHENFTKHSLFRHTQLSKINLNGVLFHAAALEKTKSSESKIL